MVRQSALLVLAVGLAQSAAADADIGRSAGPPRYDLSVALERYRLDRFGSDILDPTPYAVYGLDAVLGRYWSHHHRTEVSVAVTTRGHTRASYGCCRSTVVLISHDHRHELISLSHVLQLRRNRWLHPQIGLGATLDLEQHRRSAELRRPELVDQFLPSRSDRDRVLSAQSGTETTIRPFGQATLKVYLTRRAFLRTAVMVSPLERQKRWRVFGGLGRDW